MRHVFHLGFYHSYQLAFKLYKLSLNYIISNNIMSFSSRRRYTSRREKSAKIRNNTRRVLIATVCVVIVLIFKNRVLMWDYIRTSMY